MVKEIISGLFLGNAEDAKDIAWMKENDISTVMCCMTDEEAQLAHLYSGYYNTVGITWFNINVDDTEEERIDEYFDSTYDLITDHRCQEKNIMIHCRQGISRSATIVLAYLIRENKWTRRQAIEYVSRISPIIDPNDGFMDRLKELELKYQ
jgi:protein-tyrosine phosphatase